MMKKKPSPFFAILAFLVLVIPLFSCSKNKNTNPANQASKNIPTEMQMTNKSDKNKSSGISTAAQDLSKPQTTETKNPSLSMQNARIEPQVKPNAASDPFNNVFLPLKPFEKLDPVDFKIGSLNDYYAETKDESGILKLLVGFFDSLKKGEIKKELIGEMEYLKIFRIISPSLESNQPSGYRIGTINLAEKDESYAHVRLFNKEGSTDGIVYCSKRENIWYITDVQIDLSVYIKENPGEKFMPSANNWIY
jgi:hypothetical protein